jgi:hypothetical protein
MLDLSFQMNWAWRLALFSDQPPDRKPRPVAAASDMRLPEIKCKKAIGGKTVRKIKKEVAADAPTSTAKACRIYSAS